MVNRTIHLGKTLLGPTFSGAGDAAGANAESWFGLRAYSAASLAAAPYPALDIVDQAGANSATINILSTGALDTAAIATWVAAHSVTTIYVSKAYDHRPAAMHMVQTTQANRPQLIVSALGSPAIKFLDQGGGNCFLAQSGSWASTGPTSFSAVMNPGATEDGDGRMMFRDRNTGAPSFSLDSATPNRWQITDKGPLFSTATSRAPNNFFSAVHWVANGASSKTRIFASPTQTLTLSDGDYSTGSRQLGWGHFTAGKTTYGREVGFWPSDISANFIAIENNQAAYYGYVQLVLTTVSSIDTLAPPTLRVVSPLDLTFTVDAGLQKSALVVFVANDYDLTSVANTPTVVWDNGGTNQAMTLIDSQIGADSRIKQIFAFGLLNPTAGTKTCRVTWTSSTGTVSLSAFAAALSNVNQASIAAAFGSTKVAHAAASGVTTVAVSASPGDLILPYAIVDGNGSSNGTFSPGQVLGITGYQYSDRYLPQTALSASTTFTQSTDVNWTFLAVVARP